MSNDPKLPKRHVILPAHQRARPLFAELFGRDQIETIRSMDESGSDIPNQAPATALRIQGVGVTRKSIPVAIFDPLGSGEVLHLSCDISASVGLGLDRRGIHVSRIGDHLAKLSGAVYQSLEEYALLLSQMLRHGQQSESASVAVSTVFTYIEQVVGVKEKSSLEHLNLTAKTECVDDQLDVRTGVGFTHITACPCVQETYRNTLVGITPAMPFFTHSQRCRTYLELRNISPAPGLSELLARIDAVVIRSQNTLPRDHELLNVFRAHARAQFLEDILRDLLASVFESVRGRSPKGFLAIESTSMESIHDFDLNGEIGYSLAELEQRLSGPA